MSHTISKDELRRPDHLTEAGISFFKKILKNQKLVLGVIGILFIAGVGFVVWEKNSLSRELSIQEQYYSTEKTYLKKKEAFDKAEADKKTPLAKDEKAPAEKLESASGDLTKDYGPEVEAWNKLIESHPSSKAAAMAALELAQLFQKYNKTSEALQLLSRVKNQQNSDNLLGAMVFHAYANLLAGQNQCQEAVGIWENLEKKKHMNFLVEQAQMGQALCFETLGQVEKAEGLLKELVAGRTSTDKQAQAKAKSQTQRSAEKYLRYLQVKKNMTATKPS